MITGADARRRNGHGREPALDVTVLLVVVMATLLSACDGPRPDELADRSYPEVSVGPTAVVTYELGPGSLETTDDAPWDGSSHIVYPVVIATEVGPVEVEVHGLDLSGIEYTGDLGWPPDGTDTGALFQVRLVGSSEVAVRIYSSLAAFAPEGTLDHRDGLRAYQLSGFNDGQGPYGTHQFDLEPWGPNDSERSYDTFDLRFRYDDGLVESWVRMHASRDWDEGERDAGGACPSNVALNNVAPGTEDRVWAGQCTDPEPGSTGLAVGAWIPVEGGAWSVSDRPGPARVSLYLSNWALADGPYHVSWANVTVRGVPDESVTASSGEGRLRAFGTGRAEREPRGEWASISYLASYSWQTPPSGLFRYRGPAFEVTTHEIDWLEVTASEATLEGPARVNGTPGYRFEFHGMSAEGSEPARVSLRVWSPVPSTAPYFEAFGSLAEGSIQVQPGERD